MTPQLHSAVVVFAADDDDVLPWDGSSTYRLNHQFAPRPATNQQSISKLQASSRNRNANDIRPDLLPKKANANMVRKGGCTGDDPVLLEARSRPSVFSKKFSLYPMFS